MSSDSVSVTLAAPQAPYQTTLASSLIGAHMLGRLLRVTPDLNLEVLEAAPDGFPMVTKRFPSFRLGTRLLSAAWRCLPEAFQPRVAVPALASSWLADTF